MLRINLLPPYIYAGKTKGRVTAVWVIVLIAVIGGLLFFKSTIDKQTEEINKTATDLEPKAAKADSDQSKANDTNAKSATVRAKADFVRGAIKHDQEVYPNLYRNVVMYTWNRVLYDYIRPEGSTVSMSAYTPSLSDVAHYIMAMERNPNISRVDIRMGSIPGFPAGATQQNGVGGQNQGGGGVRPEAGGGHDFEVTLNLYQPIPEGPKFGAGGGAASAPAGGGMPGMSSGGFSSGGTTSGGMSSGGMGSGGPSSGGRSAKAAD